MKTEILFDIERLVHAWPVAGRQTSAANQAITASFEIRDFRICEGECLALAGPNGSGKTTFLKPLNGLIPAGRESRVSFAGLTLADNPELRRRSAYLHQHPYLVAGSVQYNVAWPCRERGLDRHETGRRVQAALERVGLGGFAHRDRRELSGGEVQRVALARALACGADVLLLDEPTASVDADSFAVIRDLLATIKAEGATLLMASHDPALSEGLADRQVEFRAGRIVSREKP